MAIDERQLRKLYKQGLSPNAIAARLDTSRSTVQRAIQKLGLATVAQLSTASPHPVDNGTSVALPDTLSELMQWWQERKDALADAADTSQQTERMTFHVQKRWVEALRRQADRDDTTYTQIVNEAFRQHFMKMSTSCPPGVVAVGQTEAPAAVEAPATKKRGRR